MMISFFKVLTIRRILYFCAFAASISICTAEGNTKTYEIDECAHPVRLTFQGLPDMSPLILSNVVETCGELSQYPIQYTNDKEDFDSKTYELLPNLQKKLPQLFITSKDGKLDIRLELLNEKSKRIYQTKQVSFNAKDLVLDRVGHRDGPDIRLSVEPVTEGSYLRIHVVDASADKVIQDVARIKKLKIKGMEKFTTDKITFNFNMLRIQSVLSLLADVSGLQMRKISEKEFAFGKNQDQEELDHLWNIANGYRQDKNIAQLKITLEKIVELAKPNNEEDFEFFFEGELKELAEIAEQEKDYSQAEKWHQERLAAVERVSGSPDPSVLYDFAAFYLRQTSADKKPTFGKILLIAPNFAKAKSLLEQALPIFRKDKNKEASINILSDLAGIALSIGNIDEAAELNSEAINIFLNIKKITLFETFRKVEYLEEGIILYYKGIDEALYLPLKDRLQKRRQQRSLSHGDIEEIDNMHKQYTEAAIPIYRKIQPHLKNIYELYKKMYDEDHSIVDRPRGELIYNLEMQENFNLATQYLLEQIQVFRKRNERTSGEYVAALCKLAEIRAMDENFEEATKLWKEVVEIDTQLLGEKHPQVIKLLKDFALLYRLQGQHTFASEIERKVDVTTPDDETPENEKTKSFLRGLGYINLTSFLEKDLIKKIREQREKSGDSITVAVLEERLGEVYAAVGPGSTGVDGNKFEQALMLRIKIQGLHHSDTQRAAHRLIEFYKRSNDTMMINNLMKRMGMRDL